MSAAVAHGRAEPATLSPMSESVLVVGAGIFGVTAALELCRRGHPVTVLDPGPLPRPEASSTDVSKAVRLDYGADAFYTEMAAAARDLWLSWNHRFGEELYRQDGFLFLRRSPMQPGDFETESVRVLQRRGFELELLDRAALGRRFPVWRGYEEAYFNPHDGWAASARVVECLLQEVEAAGATLARGTMRELVVAKGLVRGVRCEDGTELRADLVVIAAGAWTPVKLPWLAGLMWPIGQPVVHFEVDRPDVWRPPAFVTWASDIATTGWYGFPATAAGALKVANHGPGRRVHPDQPREVLPEEEARCRRFLREALPRVADAPVVSRRLCLYCDTFDGNFWIDHDPARRGLVVAAGGSGHGFKFAPLLGPLIADVVERRPNRWAGRFRWRRRGEVAAEQARKR